eukprot:PhF_6_TR41336/c2_g1_i1/m.62705
MRSRVTWRGRGISLRRTNVWSRVRVATMSCTTQLQSPQVSQKSKKNALRSWLEKLKRVAQSTSNTLWTATMMSLRITMRRHCTLPSFVVVVVDTMHTGHHSPVEGSPAPTHLVDFQPRTTPLQRSFRCQDNRHTSHLI